MGITSQGDASRLTGSEGASTADRAGREPAIGLAVLDIHNQVYADFADGVAEIVRPAGYRLLLELGGYAGESAAEGLRSLVGLGVDGILLATHVDETIDVASATAGTPTVVLGAPKGSSHVDAVHGDDRVGGRLATEHLIAAGHRDILYLGGPPDSQSPARAAGYRDAMNAAGLAPREEEGDATESAGYTTLLRLRRAEQLPSAVFCYNDATAIGVLACAKRELLAVPRDLAVVGYDNTRAAGYPGVELSTIDQQARLIGQRAAELLLARISHPEGKAHVEVFTPRLIVRESTNRFISPGGAR
ncbi:LacI family DNA-binding transcriptional regulator [Microbacterium atlanticum]|uniref:LacI family DNA-binding transcriptional regulator n=1 Tax=Microbacterium atlanticum TaxID=2782168 RepID=UPI0018890D60|nr:substrate-binding domain-containing protein [Microbacterium atlanticum]